MSNIAHVTKAASTKKFSYFIQKRVWKVLSIQFGRCFREPLHIREPWQNVRERPFFRAFSFEAVAGQLAGARNRHVRGALVTAIRRLMLSNSDAVVMDDLLRLARELAVS